MKLMKLYYLLRKLQNKSLTFDRFVDWFGDTDYGLGLPFLIVLVFLLLSLNG
jgi:hypothetical protein